MQTAQDRTKELINSLARSTDQVFSLDELSARLNSGAQLRIKFGADITAPFLHLGHGVNLRMMRQFQELGHKVIFLLGDFTTRIGDPTGKSSTRPEISSEHMEQFAQTWLRQVGRALTIDDPRVFECRRNSEWYNAMGTAEFLGLCGKVTHARLASRDMFRKRMAEGSDIHMHEMLYPLLQGWDSVMLESDLTIVGSDQLFNEMMGRFFQERAGQKPQIIMTSKITPGLDGVQKQSKSLNNYIAIEDDPRTMFGKAMSLRDDLIIPWMEVYTDLELSEVNTWKNFLNEGKNPRDAKLKLASALVELWHGNAQANTEHDWFSKTFGKVEFPADAPEVFCPLEVQTILALLSLVQADKSRSELRRLLSQGAVSINGKVFRQGDDKLTWTSTTMELKIGKRSFYRLSCKE